MNIFKIIKKIFKKFFFPDRRIVNRYARQANKVIFFEKQMCELSDKELKLKTQYFKNELKNGKTLDDIKFEAFAVVREAAKRTLGQFPFKVQIIGAFVLHDGDIAEMRTGEGKTLTSTMAVYLNALTGKSVHVVTVNEYLASRDANWMGQIYTFLGLTVGVNLKKLSISEKQKVYACDIVYTTNSELGFDYLRDNMVKSADQRVIRGLEYAIIDEVDSILIDESRTPLIISGGQKFSSSQYIIVDNFVKTLKKDVDFLIDIKENVCYLTSEGGKKAEIFFKIANLYDNNHSDLVHRIYQSLKANFIMIKDVEYLVDKDRQIKIIDQFTGRILKNMEYSDGLHQAIQAKENVEIKPETITLATITYQNFFKLYKKLSGMTGTAKTEEEEFQKIYNMCVTCIPTNKPIIREDAPDFVYAHKKDKLNALLEDVCNRNKKGQPILIGTISVESSEEITQLLRTKNLKFEVLNAKNHAREAEIISHAGEKNQITVATNMAGRGTDIKLGPGVIELGGLCVLGTERHESRRIDNQLRGRAGRQGDPGFSRFYVSLDDELMRRFVNDTIIKRFEILGSEAIESSLITHVITNAQKQVEGRNFDIRKNLLDYDNVLSKQREIIYEKRNKILDSNDINDIVNDFFYNFSFLLAKKSVFNNKNNKNTENEKLIDAKILKKEIEQCFLYKNNDINYDLFNLHTIEEVGVALNNIFYGFYLKMKKKIQNKGLMNTFEKHIALKIIDQEWTKHIDIMTNFREGIYLRSYANINPLQEYVNEGYLMFKELFNKISFNFVCEFFKQIYNAGIELK